MVRALEASFVLLFSLWPRFLIQNFDWIAWNSLGNRKVFRSNGVNFGGLSESFKMGAAYQKDQTQHFQPHPILWEGEVGWRFSSGPIIPLWWNLHKNSRSTGFRELCGWWAHLFSGRVTHPSTPHTEAPVLETLPDTALCISSMYLAAYLYPSLYPLLYNKLVSISFPPSSISRSNKWPNAVRGSWEPHICSQVG